jgi:hypothetical protein
VYFTGTSSYLSVANNTLLNFGTGQFTIELWFYTTVQTGTTQVLVSNYLNSTQGYSITLTNSINAQFSGDGSDISGTTPISTFTWNHVALSGNGVNGYKLFLNGVQTGSTYSSGTVALTSSAATTIGVYSTSLTSPFTGYISNVRILNGTALYSIINMSK